MMGGQFVFNGLVDWETQFACQALQYEFEILVLPSAVDTGVRIGLIFVVRADHQIPDVAMWTFKSSHLFKLARRADIATIEMMNAGRIRDMCGTTDLATTADRRHRLASRTQQDAIVKPWLKDAEFRPAA